MRVRVRGREGEERERRERGEKGRREKEREREKEGGRVYLCLASIQRGDVEIHSPKHLHEFPKYKG